MTGMDRTRFLAEEDRNATLFKSQRMRWCVTYHIGQGIAGSVGYYHTLDSAFAYLARKGYIPQVARLPKRMQAYWTAVSGTIQVKMRFEEVQQ